MRRTLTLCRTGLAGAAAFVLLTACGGGDSDSSASSSSASDTTTSSSSSSEGAAGDSEFCQQASDLDSQLSSIGDVSDPAQFGTVLREAADRLKAIEPPTEIESDWNALVGAVDQLAQAAATTDFNDPQQAAAFAQTASQLESQLGAASTNVESYLRDQCGIDTTGGETASPTT